jgi:hypothetical protein
LLALCDLQGTGMLCYYRFIFFFVIAQHFSAASRSDIDHGDKRKSRRREAEKIAEFWRTQKSSTRGIHKFVRVVYGV